MDNDNKNVNDDLLNELEDATEVTSEDSEETVAETTNETSVETVAETPAEDSVEETVNEEPKDEALVEEPATNTSEINDSKPEAIPSEVSTKDEKKPKVSKGAKVAIIISAIALVLIIAIVVIANGAQIANTFRKLTMSPEKYTQYVLKESITDYSDAMFDRLRLSNPSGNTTNSTTVSFMASEDFIDELDFPQGVDEDMLSDLSVNVVSSKFDDISATKFTFMGQDGFEVFNIEVFIDIEDEVAYIRCPEMNETFLEVDLSEYFDRRQISTISDAMNSLSNEDIDTLNRLFNKYVVIALSQIEDVDEYTETMKVEGVSQKFTALEFDIDGDLVENIIVSVFEEMIDDEELADFAEDKMPSDAVYNWDDVTDFLSTVVDEAEDEGIDEDFGTITFYVNSKGEIKGFYYESEDDFEVTAIEIVNGAKFAFEYSIETRYSELSLTGVGKMVFGKINAHFVLEAEDLELEADLQNGVFNSRKMTGTITFNLEDWLDEMGAFEDDRSMKDAVEDMIVTVDFNFTVDAYSVMINAENEDDMSVTIAFSSETAELKDSIDLPRDTEDDPDSYFEDCDSDDLADNLREFGFSRDMSQEIADELVYELEEIVYMMIYRTSYFY